VNQNTIAGMPTTVKRRYHSPAREAAAHHTRSRIRDVAGRLFVEQGYVSTTIRQIADVASVGVRTVFAAFPDGKSQLFAESLDLALGGDDERIPVALRPVTQAVLDESEGQRAVVALVDGASELYERAGALITTYLESAGADAVMRDHADRGAAEATRIMHEVAGSLHRHGALRADISVREAGDLLLALCSPQLHHLLRRRRRWSDDRYRHWLTEAITRTLLEPDDPTGPASSPGL
jgi:AcrR family transcriptional regulator